MKNFEVYQYDTTAAYLVSKHCKCDACPMYADCGSALTHEDVKECFDRWKEFFDEYSYILLSEDDFADVLQDMIDCDKCPLAKENKCDVHNYSESCRDAFLKWLNEERRTCQVNRQVETRREFFMENPDEFEGWLRRINGEVRYPVDKHRARTDKKYIGTCMCSNMRGCDVCPVPLDEDGLCDDMCDEWLDSPLGSEPSDVVPDKKKTTIWSSNIRRALKTVRTNSLIHDSLKERKKEPKLDAETVIKFIAQNLGRLDDWEFNDGDCGEYMYDNHPEICDACRMNEEDICKCWEIYIREKSQEETK